MKLAFVAKQRGIWPAGWLCEALGVSRGGFYAWLTRPRAQRRGDGNQDPHQLHRQRSHLRRPPRLTRSPGRRRRLWSASDRAADAGPGNAGTAAAAAATAGQGRADDERHLAEPCSIASSPPRPRTASGLPTSPTSGRPRGWLFVAAVVDLFSRRVVGWSMSATMTAQFVADALIIGRH